MATRSQKEEKNYQHYAKNIKQPGCDFCRFRQNSDQVISEEKAFYVVKNIFGYSHWDSSRVEEHFMIVPKRHITSLGDYNKKELDEYAKLIQKYESQGFSIYSRPNLSHMKSVPHQHTHLIKLKDGRHRFFMHIQRPYFRIRF